MQEFFHIPLRMEICREMVVALHLKLEADFGFLGDEPSYLLNLKRESTIQKNLGRTTFPKSLHQGPSQTYPLLKALPKVQDTVSFSLECRSYAVLCPLVLDFPAKRIKATLLLVGTCSLHSLCKQ